ncbi:TonB-dependent receptor [Runella aurantiaca]|uniref:TonB-dependent receptor n=1 Tax=Runella aurantiaca TaxID=2282308 RepID=A0A369I301_9BACT|nr:TonB-dependent receptor [Runella aurantiaca]RDB03280.1 TonB-dependent receptor [Runella aurantiaca]
MKKILVSLLVSQSLYTLLSQDVLAQKPTGEIDSQTFEVEKKKKIELPPANRLYNKLQPFTNEDDDRKLNYEFRAPKLTLGAPKMTPNVLPVNGNEKPEEDGNLQNYVKLGGGNYGKVYGEGFMGGHTEDLGYDVHFKHLSNQTGPVDGKNSANSENRLKINGQYLGSTFKLGGTLFYDRDNYYFYANRNQPNAEVQKANIRQTLNTFGLQVGFENIDNNKFIDYALKTSLYRLSDRYNAGETDWGTNFSGSIPITENIFALLNADAFVSQRVDAETFKRNMFSIKPAFKFAYNAFTVTAAFKAVNETDDRLKINRTVGFPQLEVDAVPFNGVHIFAGYGGDMTRNTLRSLLGENRWLAPNVIIANTERSRDIYGGLKGEVGPSFQFEGKVSYALFKNFYGFNNDWLDSTKFAVVYDADYINVLTVSAQVGYQYQNIVRSTLRGDFYDYGVKRLEQPWGRPTTTVTWNNHFVFSKKMFATIDAYYIGGIKNRNFLTGKTVALKPIVDLNLKVDYLLTRNFSIFASVNNLLGKSYERYLYYPQQGLNFLAGLSLQF